MTKAKESGGWLVVEAVGETPSLIFDTDRTKEFSNLRRRQHWLKSPVTAAVTELVAELEQSRARVVRRTVYLSPSSTVAVVAVPVLGPPEDWDGNPQEPAVYGAQVWVGPPDVVQPPARKVGAFTWDPLTHLTGNGESIDLDIMGLPQHLGIRPSSEVFKLYTDFPRQAELGEFAALAESGEAPEGHEFTGDITLHNAKQDLIRIMVAIRAVTVLPGKMELRGILHDISDIRPPAQASGHLAARELASLVANPDTGVAVIDLATKVVLEWLSAPPELLSQWNNVAAEWKSPEQVSERLASIVTGDVSAVQFDTAVRFNTAAWVEVTVTLRALVRRPETGGGTGILVVTRAQEA